MRPFFRARRIGAATLGVGLVAAALNYYVGWHWFGDAGKQVMWAIAFVSFAYFAVLGPSATEMQDYRRLREGRIPHERASREEEDKERRVFRPWLYFGTVVAIAALVAVTSLAPDIARHGVVASNDLTTLAFGEVVVVIGAFVGWRRYRQRRNGERPK